MKNIITKFVSIFNNHQSSFIISLATLLSITAASYFFFTNQTLLYNDARSHMDISRRVFDSLTPGLLQIGSVWLPLYHILMLPFVQNDYLWHTGLAGTIVSAFSYIISCYFIFKTIKLITKSTIISLIGFLLFSLNPNLLYLQSVPLDEVLAVASVSASIYFILKWSKTDYQPDLIFAAFFAFLGSLSRYEVWFLILAEAIFVFLHSLDGQLFSKIKKAEGLLVLFSFLAFSGIFLWFLYNFLGWNDPLYFLHNPSAHLAQQKEFEKNGLLPTKHNLFLSIYVLLTNIIENIGPVLTSISAISLAMLLLLKDKFQNKLFYLVTLSPLGFLLLTLYFGITVLFTKFFPSPGTADKIFNVRYGVIALIPAVIITCTALFKLIKFSKVKTLTYSIFLTLLAGDILFFATTGMPATIQDGKTGISGFGQANEVVMSETVKNNCQNGKTLISAGQDEIIMFESGFPMKQFIYEGSGKYWRQALENPAENAVCIVLQKNGFVERGLNEKNSDWQKNYEIIFNAQGNSVIYKLAGKNTQPIVAPETPESTPSAQSENMYSFTVKPGDSLSRLYRQAINNYSIKQNSNLSNKEKLFMENYLVLNLPRFKLQTGDEFKISDTEINTAHEHAKSRN